MSSKDSALSIGGQTVELGQRCIIELPMPNLYDCTPLTMPVHVIRGKLPGPILGITAAVHGDEICGVEIIRRILKKPSIKRLNGTLIAIPIVNIFGFLYQSRYLMDRRDLNRAFPGSNTGSIAARLAYLISTEILIKCSHFIDLHSGSLHRTNLPQIRTDLDMPGMEELAKAFKAPVILHSKLRDGSMREYADNMDIPFLLYEAGESLRFDELSIRTGVNGVINVMRKLNMLNLVGPQRPTRKKKQESAISRHSYWVRAPKSGILHSDKALGKMVNKGELLAKIGNPTTTEEYRLEAPISGIIIGKVNLPIVHEGSALFHIATFEDEAQAVAQIAYLQDEFSGD